MSLKKKKSILTETVENILFRLDVQGIGPSGESCDIPGAFTRLCSFQSKI